MQTITADLIVTGFRLIEKVGVGTAGEVWRGTDGEQIVAVKFLNTSLLESPNHKKHRRRFRNEAIALQYVADLPHIPTHLHHDLEVERPYIIMEYVNSAPLSDLIINGEMMYVPLPKRLHALQRVAETLSIVHQRGIIHRDIKPSNIHGLEHPYLLDFSVGFPAKYGEKADPRVGTPLYLTPDLIPPSARTDSYAFAIVVYEILFGRHPIFDYLHIPESIDELRQVAGEAIMEETWHRPNQLTESDLPINLHGADLEQLTQVFQNALMLSDDRYGDVLIFMMDVLEAVHVEDNLPYLEQVPILTDEVGSEQVANISEFTDHMVAVYAADTDLPDIEISERIGTRQWIIGLSMLFGMLFVVLVVLVLSPS